MSELLAQLNATLERGLPCVYCAVVATRGSTPQKAGAAMLVFPDGTQAGTLGGGCVEAEVKRRVLHELNDAPGPRVFSFLLDDDYGWDDGLICGGQMTILAHPIRPESPAADYEARIAPNARTRRGLHRSRGDRGSRGVEYWRPLSLRRGGEGGRLPRGAPGVGGGCIAVAAARLPAPAGSSCRRRVLVHAAPNHASTRRWRARRSGGRAPRNGSRFPRLGDGRPREVRQRRAASRARIV